jgi:transcriptional regulator with XRE-family HTH domain
MTDRLARQFGEALLKARQQLGWTQVQVATRAKLGQTYVSRVERGQNTTLEAMSLLARAVGLQVTFLITRDDDQTLKVPLECDKTEDSSPGC